MVQFEAFKLKLDVSTVCEVPMLTLGLSLALICPSQAFSNAGIGKKLI